MEYDLEEAFRFDPGEDSLAPELQAQAAAKQKQEEELVAERQLEQPSPTGEQQAPPQQQTSPTGDEQPDQQWPWEEGYDFGDYTRNTLESAFAPAAGS